MSFRDEPSFKSGNGFARKTGLQRKKGFKKASPLGPKKVRSGWGYIAGKPALIHKPLKRTALKKVSKARAKQNASYFSLRREFLLSHPACLICAAKGETPRPATEVHHWAGRTGRLLCYVPYFIPSCRGCREWPHENTERARAAGVLAPPAEWNVFPG